ncbi:MAG: serine--tRNA ligase [Flavobacteriaceae bacterium]|jgi:seryl-tRNA synthetase|nr:serine--tRNA ligase [Flavobacteriaceae bacterium]
MLPLSFIRENEDFIKKGLTKRNFSDINIIDQLIELDQKRRSIMLKLETILSSTNKINKEIGLNIKSGKKENIDSLKSKSSKLKSDAKKFQEKLTLIENELFSIRTKIPNIPNEIVPEGKSYEDNEKIFESGKIPELKKESLYHWDLCKKYDLIDFDLGNKITGSGFPVYKGKGAKLQRALIQYFLDKNVNAGYKEYQIPHLVNQESAFGTGQLPDKDGQMYHIENDKLYLIPTAEVPLTNIFRDKLLELNELPIKLTAYSPCFRREAGSYGKNVRGLNRLHQFDKVEIVRIEEPKNAISALDGMVNHIKKILNELELPYRILRLCGSDLGFTSALTYDFEVFSAAQKKWLEISSVSTFNNFQSERLRIRYKNTEGKKSLVYTLNGSSLALPRVIASLFENFQTEKGIKIPDIIIPYTGFNYID